MVWVSIFFLGVAVGLEAASQYYSLKAFKLMLKRIERLEENDQWR